MEQSPPSFQQVSIVADGFRRRVLDAGFGCDDAESSPLRKVLQAVSPRGGDVLFEVRLVAGEGFVRASVRGSREISRDPRCERLSWHRLPTGDAPKTTDSRRAWSHYSEAVSSQIRQNAGDARPDTSAERSRLSDAISSLMEAAGECAADEIAGLIADRLQSWELDAVIEAVGEAAEPYRGAPGRG